MKYIVTNFAYGTGPYLRTTELAIAFNDELERRGESRLPIIIPWVYGEKQRTIMQEDFGSHITLHPHELLLDQALGAILKKVFYSGSAPYQETLVRWVQEAESVSREAHEHLKGTFTVYDFAQNPFSIHGSEIVLELNRSPRIRYDVAPAYSTTFGYIADILESACGVPRDIIAVDSELLHKGVMLADKIEGNQEMHAMAYPATFSWEASTSPRYNDEVLVPPITNLPKIDESVIADGIFVTVTGIDGLERLYREAQQLGLRLYSNDIDAVPGSQKALPTIIPNSGIQFQFARAGWGSLWLSMFAGTPIVVPKYDPTDDPEIYFNTVALTNLGFGTVYEGQSLQEIVDQTEQFRSRAHEVREVIRSRFGTLNGNDVCARLFVDRFLS